MTPIADLTAIEMATRVRAGSLTAEAVSEACLEAVREREGAVQAWQYLDVGAVRAQVRQLDIGTPNGLLHGIPIGVKDIFDTWDMPTGYGSDIYAHHQPAVDAAVVASTRAVGGVIFGKTVTTEFAAFKANQTRNPHDPQRTPGGSSSGSAAAVAAGMVPLAFGTQTAGSVIRPASYCGVVGYKPTFGLLPPAGVKTFAWSLDTVGVFARSVPDAAFFAGVLSERPLHTALGETGHPRIGLCRTPQWEEAGPGTMNALEQAVQRLSRSGAEVSESVLSYEFDSLLDAQKVIMAYEGARALAFERFAHGERLSASLRGLLEEGAAITAEVYDAAVATARLCRQRLQACMDGVDVLLAPSVQDEAPRGTGTGDPVFNRIWTLLGTPCVNVPGLHGKGGLPVGVQIIGAIGDDARALAVADWVMDRIVE